jgi:hypothetical protein
MTGDFSQMPAIADVNMWNVKELRGKNRKNYNNLYARAADLYESFEDIIFLDINYRQKETIPEDKRFIEILSNIAKGICNREDFEFLYIAKEREIQGSPKCLFFSRTDTDNAN